MGYSDSPFLLWKVSSFVFTNSLWDYHLQIFHSPTSLISKTPQKNLGREFPCPERDWKNQKPLSNEDVTNKWGGKMQERNKHEVKSIPSVSLQLIVTWATLVVLHLYLFKFQQTIKRWTSTNSKNFFISWEIWKLKVIIKKSNRKMYTYITS